MPRKPRTGADTPRIAHMRLDFTVMAHRTTRFSHSPGVRGSLPCRRRRGAALLAFGVTLTAGRVPQIAAGRGAKLADPGLRHSLRDTDGLASTERSARSGALSSKPPAREGSERNQAPSTTGTVRGHWRGGCRAPPTIPGGAWLCAPAGGPLGPAGLLTTPGRSPSRGYRDSARLSRPERENAATSRNHHQQYLLDRLELTLT